VTFSRF